VGVALAAELKTIMKYHINSVVAVVVGCITFLCISILLLLEVMKYQTEPYMDEIFHVAQAQRYCAGRYSEVFGSVELWNFRSLELSFSRTFVSGTKVTWNFRYQELSFHGTFVPTVNVTWFRSPNTNYHYLIDKLTEIILYYSYYSLFVFLYRFIVVKDGRI